jgi:solute carrier family 25 folate transporter 32
MQVTDVNANGTYRSLIAGFRSVMALEGPSGFYRGITPAIIASSGSWGGYFYFYEIAKKRMMENSGNDKLRTQDHVSARKAALFH